MKRTTISISILTMFFLNPLNVYAGSVNVENDAQQSQTTLSQGGSILGPVIDYGNDNGDNRSVGSLGNQVGGNFIDPTAIPLHYGDVKSDTPNNVSATTVFAIFPRKINRDTIRIYKKGIEEEYEKHSSKRGRKNFDDVKKSIRTKPTVFYESEKAEELYVVPWLLKNFKEGFDYKKVAVVVKYSIDDTPHKQDLAMDLIEWGLDHGANILIPISQIDGGEKKLKNKAGGLSLFTSVANVAVSSMTGFTVNPNMGYSSGASFIEANAFLGVLFLKVNNPEEFYWKSEEVFSQKKKSKLVKYCEQNISKLDNILFTTFDEKKSCKERFWRGIYNLIVYQETKSKNSLMKAKDDFAKTIAIVNNANDIIAKDCHFYLSAIYREMAKLQEPGTDREIFWVRAGIHGEKARIPGDSTPPSLERITLTKLQSSLTK
ncbi:hypothetical protein KAI92_03160 [Candidatus Parcubacteria bacterium]|nr:hypothetical protein [Candidatus Parcubacteria bacterium]